MGRFRRYIIYALIIFFLFTLLLYNFIDEANRLRNSRESNADQHFLCIVVPYRDRLNALQRMVPHISNFLEKQKVLHKIIIVNQTDEYRFNRASLINVGWIEANKTRCDYICMHDVDLLPLNTNISYRYPGKGVIQHISAGKYHPIKRYDYPKFIGGILMLTMDDFLAVNGMSNKYWGWGLEDDEFYLRLKDANLTNAILRPENLTTKRNDTFEHIHSSSQKRDMRVIGNQRKVSRRRDRTGGLNSVSYTIKRISQIQFGHYDATIVNVRLNCNATETPYCKDN